MCDLVAGHVRVASAARRGPHVDHSDTGLKTAGGHRPQRRGSTGFVLDVGCPVYIHHKYRTLPRTPHIGAPTTRRREHNKASSTP